MVMLLVVLVPCVTVTLAGEAETLKFGWDAAFTVSAMAVVSVVLPEVPLTVMLYVSATTDAASPSPRPLALGQYQYQVQDSAKQVCGLARFAVGVWGRPSPCRLSLRAVGAVEGRMSSHRWWGSHPCWNGSRVGRNFFDRTFAGYVAKEQECDAALPLKTKAAATKVLEAEVSRAQAKTALGFATYLYDLTPHYGPSYQ